MQLNLRKPIIFFDLETTGVNITHDRIIEISVIKLCPNGERIERTRRINPEMHIPEETTAIHGISDHDVAQEPTFKQLAHSIAQLFAGADIAGFNSNRFDLPMLDQEFRRAGIDFDFSSARFIDVQTIFHKKEQRTLSAAYKFYCNDTLEDAHSALADTRATLEVLMAQLDRYDDLPNDIGQLSQYCCQTRNVDLMGRLILNDQDQPVINFGKYKGRLATEVLNSDPGYYGWIMKGDFSDNTKAAFTRIKMGLKAR